MFKIRCVTYRQLYIEAEAYINMQSKISEYFRNAERRKSFLKVPGLLITYGRK